MTASTPDIPEADRASGCPHPRETYDLIGHQESEGKFITSHSRNRLHHAWLLSGPKGIGKATLAYRMTRRILGAQSLLDQSLDVSASDPVAQRIESQGHGDVFVLRRPYDFKSKKLKSEIPVAETRKMADFFAHKPAEGGWRVCIVDSMDEMNRNSENAILKSLEEPPKQTILILIAHNPGRLLPTIRSRCLHLQLRPVATEQLVPWLKRMRPEDSDNIVDAAVRLSRGGPGRAFALASNSDKVLKPLTQFLASLGKSDVRLDQIIANQMTPKTMRSERQLFWEALQDILQAQARFSMTGDWHGAFKPLPIKKTPASWTKLWEKTVHLQNREQALNMDKKAVMYDVLSSIRQA